MKPKVRARPITKTRNGTWNGTLDGTWNGMGYGNLEQTHGTRNGNTLCSNYTTHKFETLRREIKADIRKQHDLYVNNLVGEAIIKKMFVCRAPTHQFQSG